MTTSLRTWVRASLVGVLALLGLIATVSEARSQFGRPPVSPPPRPPVGFGGMPGGISGISGMPSGITGIGGRPTGITGISGMPSGFSGIGGAGISGISGMPSGISGIGGAGISGISGGTGISGISGFGGFRTESVWTCSGCRKELGRGPNKPSYTTCPHCSGRFVNGGIGGGGFTMTGPPSFSSPPSASPPGPSFPPTSSPPAADPNPSFTVPNFDTGNSGSGYAAAPPISPPAEPREKSGMVWKVILLVAAAMGVIAATGGALVWNANRAAQNRRRFLD